MHCDVRRLRVVLDLNYAEVTSTNFVPTQPTIWGIPLQIGDSPLGLVVEITLRGQLLKSRIYCSSELVTEMTRLMRFLAISQ